MKRFLLVLGIILFTSCDNNDDGVDYVRCEDLTQKINATQNSLNVNYDKLSDLEKESMRAAIKVWESQKKELGC